MPSLPALMLLHGVGDDGACWGPFVERLRSQDGLVGLRAITPDAPGHGGRGVSPGHTLAFADQVAEAVELVAQCTSRSGGPVVLGGHSMGSAVALDVAAARPDLVAALWLEDPPLFASFAEADSRRSAELDLAAMRPWLHDLQSVSLDELIAAVRTEHPDWPPAEYAPWAQAKQAVDLRAFDRPTPWHVTRWAHQARAVQCAVVLAAGRVQRGGLVAQSAAADLATLANWTVLRMPTGHDVRRDAPEATAAALAALIRSVAG